MKLTKELKLEEIKILETLYEINRYLMEQLWMDFEIIEYSKNALRIIGSIDISDKPVMELIFEDVFFVSAPLNWKTDTSKEVIFLLSEEEAKKINSKYHVEHGYHIIKMRPEDYPDDFGCIFGVKKVFFHLI